MASVVIGCCGCDPQTSEQGDAAAPTTASAPLVVVPPEFPDDKGTLILRFANPPKWATIELRTGGGRKWVFTSFPVQVAVPLNDDLLLTASTPLPDLGVSRLNVWLTEDAPTHDVTMSVRDPSTVMGPFGFPLSMLPEDVGFVADQTRCDGRPAGKVFEYGSWGTLRSSGLIVDAERRVWRIERVLRRGREQYDVRYRLVGHVESVRFEAMVGLIDAARVGELLRIPHDALIADMGSVEVSVYSATDHGGHGTVLGGITARETYRIGNAAAGIILRWMAVLERTAPHGPGCPDADAR